MQRLTLGRSNFFRLLVETDTGTLADLDAPPTYSVTGPDGAVVATGTYVSDPGPLPTGLYRFPIIPEALGLFEVTTNGLLDGDPYVQVEEFRVVDRTSVPLSSLRTDPTIGELPDREFLSAVAGAEDALEAALRYRIVTTADRLEFRLGVPQQRLTLPEGGPFFPQEVLFCSLDGVEIDLATIEIDDDGSLIRPTSASWDFLTGGPGSGRWQPGKYVVEMKHGLTQTPSDIQKAVRVLARTTAPIDDRTIPARATKIFQAETEIWFGRRGPDTWFGIPEVDDVVITRKIDPKFAVARPSNASRTIRTII